MKVPDKFVKNVKIDTAYKEVGVVSKLTEKEFDKVTELYKSMKDPTPIKFDDKTDLIIAKIPEQLKPREMKEETHDGKKQFSVSVIHTDGKSEEKWFSVIIDEDEKNSFEAYQGCKVAIIGKMTTKEGTEGKVFNNIKRYRGSMVLEGKDATKDNMNV